MNPPALIELFPLRSFVRRHIGPSEPELRQMTEELGFSSLEEFIGSAVPGQIRSGTPLRLDPARTEDEVIEELSSIASMNKIFRSLIGMGYSDTITPAVIRRNILVGSPGTELEFAL